MKNKKVVCASAIGKTAFCPHAHYLSTRFPPDKASKKRMAIGTKKHDKLTRIESSNGGLGFVFWLALIGTVLFLVDKYLIRLSNLL